GLPGERMSGLRFRLSARVRKLLLSLFAVVMVVYFAFAAFIWRTMHQPPEAFGRVMANMPRLVVFLFFPFETLWTRARAGALDVGDPAPDFSLLKVDKICSVLLFVLHILHLSLLRI